MINPRKIIIAACVVCASWVLITAALAWTEPQTGVTPPNGNVAAPINTGSVDQSKSGNLTVAGGLTISSTGGTGSAFALNANDGAHTGTPLVVGQDGNVGIGTTSPAGRLDVEGGKICLNHDCCDTWEHCFGD